MAQPKHQVEIPSSTSTVKVSIIDTSARLGLVPLNFFAGPDINGFKKFTAVAYAFLVTHTNAETGKETKIIFDLGPPKEWETDLPKPLVENIQAWNADLQITKYVSEILEENGVPLDSIDAVVWSHAHWDHIGRVSLFPKSTKLITGPGVKDFLYPGYPERADSQVLSREFKDRVIQELDFTNYSPANTTIGGFEAIDFFQDGSFYLLSAKGHAVGHVNGLARTTADPNSTFILMGADSYHQAGQLRPNTHTILPGTVNLSEPPTLVPCPCPGEMFKSVHPAHPPNRHRITERYESYFKSTTMDPKSSPFFTISVGENGASAAIDVQAARDTIRTLQDFDGDERVLLVAAHDTSLLPVLEYFPSEANQWSQKGWKEKGKWQFLKAFQPAVDLAEKKE